MNSTYLSLRPVSRIPSTLATVRHMIGSPRSAGSQLFVFSIVIRCVILCAVCTPAFANKICVTDRDPQGNNSYTSCHYDTILWDAAGNSVKFLIRNDPTGQPGQWLDAYGNYDISLRIPSFVNAPISKHPLHMSHYVAATYATTPGTVNRSEIAEDGWIYNWRSCTGVGDEHCSVNPEYYSDLFYPPHHTSVPFSAPLYDAILPDKSSAESFIAARDEEILRLVLLHIRPLYESNNWPGSFSHTNKSNEQASQINQIKGIAFGVYQIPIVQYHDNGRLTLMSGTVYFQWKGHSPTIP